MKIIHDIKKKYIYIFYFKMNTLINFAQINEQININKIICTLG